MVAAVSSIFLSLALTIPLNAQEGGPIVIASGKGTAFNKNLEGDYPLKEYEGFPPVMIAAKVGSGAIVAAGTAGACRDGNWNEPTNPYPYFDELLDATFQWMKSGARSVLWYEGYSVYTTASGCRNLLDSLQAKGYSIGTDNRAYQDIENLAAYDILVIPQMQLGAPTTGGDPSLLLDADVQAIVSFVSGGGGLLIMDQADYDGYNFSKVHNKILEALDLDIRFQDDQVQDGTNKWGGQIYQPIIDVDTETDIGSAYESVTGQKVIGLGSLCSLRIVKDYEVTVRIEVPINMGEAGETLTYQLEIINIGKKSDDYTLTVVDELGWSPSVTPSVVTLENGGSRQVEVKVTVPSLTTKVVNWITLKAVGASGAEDNARFRAVNISPTDEPPYPIAYPEKTTYGWSLATLIVELPAVPIITGVETGYSIDLTPREPWPTPYGKGEFPPAAAAALVGEGRIIATGISWMRSTPVDWYPKVLREYLPFLPRWLIDWKDPRGIKFLYYCTDPNPPIMTFHTSDKVETWLNDLQELGFENEVQEGGEITPELLEDYSVLQIAELKTPLSDDEKQAIVNWVRGGGGLLLGEQPDYQGYGYSLNSNELLEALEVPIRFQDDELYDMQNWTHDGAWFPQIYLLDPREVNPEFDVWFSEYAFTTGMPVKSITADKVRVLFSLTITNTGTKDSSYRVEAEEITSPPLGWDVEVKPTEVEAAPGEESEIFIFVTVPDIAERKRMDLSIKVTDAEQDYLTKSERFGTLGEDGRTPPSEAKLEVGQSVSHPDWGEVTIVEVAWDGSSWAYLFTADGELKVAAEGEFEEDGPPSPAKDSTWIIVAAIVVIVIVVAAVYFILKRGKGKPEVGLGTAYG